MTKQPTKPPKETKEQEEARRSQTSPPPPPKFHGSSTNDNVKKALDIVAEVRKQTPATPPPKSTEEMVPMQSVSVTVDEVAMRIFTRIYMDIAGRSSEHLANSAFDAAEKFIKVARSRKTQNV